MTSRHSPDAVNKQAESNPMALVTWVAIGTVALVVGIVLLAKFAVGAYGGRSLENDPAMKPEALALRIGPVAKLQLEGAAEVAPAAQAPAAKVATVTPAPAAAGKPDGKKTYDTACMACHATGAANAPKLGDKAAWAPRIAEGMDAMMKIAIHGKGAMPPRGATTATDDELRAAVTYMADAAK